MKPGASVARRSRVKPAAEAITRSVELQSDTEISHAEPEVRIHLPPAKSPLRTSLACLAIRSRSSSSNDCTQTTGPKILTAGPMVRIRFPPAASLSQQ